MNVFEGVAFNRMQFIGPLIILFVCMLLVGFLYARLFKWLPKEIYNYLFGPVVLLGAYIWFGPLHMGFYELFK